MMTYISSITCSVLVREVNDVENNPGPAVFNNTTESNNHCVCWPQLMELTEAQFGKRW